MNFKRMWLSLKKIVEEEYEMYGGGEAKLPISSYSEGQYDEADYILGEMNCMEVREKLLEEKERDKR